MAAQPLRDSGFTALMHASGSRRSPLRLQLRWLNCLHNDAILFGFFTKSAELLGCRLRRLDIEPQTDLLKTHRTSFATPSSRQCSDRSSPRAWPRLCPIVTKMSLTELSDESGTSDPRDAREFPPLRRVSAETSPSVACVLGSRNRILY